MKSARNLLVAIAAIVLAGCAAPRMIIPSAAGPTQDVPEPALRELAGQIEAAVARGERDHGITDYQGIVVSTPEIHQAIRTRAARREVLDEFLNTGHAWERPDGLVHVIRSREYKQAGTRNSRDRDALIVISENRDRWTLYEGLIEANNYPRNALDQIRRIFYEARLDYLEAGQKYETLDGQTAVK